MSENEPAPEAQPAAPVEPPPLIDTPEIGEYFERGQPRPTYRKIIGDQEHER